MNEPRRPGDDRDHAGQHPHHPQSRSSSHDQPADRAVPVIRLGEPQQLLTAVPYFLGYQPPTESLVLVGLRERRITLALRMALPAPEELPRPGGLADAWTAFLSSVITRDVQAIVIIAYTSPEREDEIRRFATAAPRPVLQVLRVSTGRYWSLTCPIPECDQPACSRAGAELMDNADTDFLLTVHGFRKPGTRDELARFLEPGPAAMTGAVRNLLNRVPRPDPGTLRTALTTAHSARRNGPQPMPPWEAALLLQAIGDGDVSDDYLHSSDDATWWLWSDLIRATPPEWSAPVATLIAITAYQRGDGVMAGIAAQHALAADPYYPLARLVQLALAMAIPPEQLYAFFVDGPH